jgi:two-component system, LytTR family, sensor kinase
VNPVAESRSLPRWLIYAALWLLLSCVFASQLFLAGFVTPWSRAFASEAVYWLSWGALLPAVFWWCRRLRDRALATRIAGLVLGAAMTTVLEPLAAQAIVFAQDSMQLCFGHCELGPRPFSADWFTRAVRVAGVNLPVYAGFVLAWHAATYYRELRDRQLRATELESLLHQAQLEALRSQLNPHFLFNTLHSIAELVHSNPRLAEQLIVRLGELLRQVLQSTSRQELTLAEELEFIRGYVEIEQMRLGERLRVIWDIQRDALDSRVPSLILQPLVENAIQHGIAASERAGTLTVRARRADGQLQIEVADTGPGLTPGHPGRPHGIGLANTQARLRHLYGERQTFDLKNGEGLVVSLRIPASGA